MSKIKGKFIEDLAIETGHLADGAVTEAKLHEDLANKINNKADATALDDYYDKFETDGLLAEKADASDLTASAKDANQKFFGGGDVSVEESVVTVTVNGATGTTDRPVSAGFTSGQLFIAQQGNLSKAKFNLRRATSANEGGFIAARLYSAVTVGESITLDTLLAESSQIPEINIPTSNQEVEFVFENSIELSGGTPYLIAVFNSTSQNILIRRDEEEPGGNLVSYTTTNNVQPPYSWSTQQWTLDFSVDIDQLSSALSFTEDINVARPGLALEDNVIEAPEEPIVLSDGELLYVIPNEDDQGSALTLTAATSETLPDNALVLAYRDGADIIVDGVRLESGQTAKLGQAPVAEVVDAYTKSETDALLLDKADKTETENALAGKLGTDQVDGVTIEMGPKEIALFDSPPTSGASDKDLEPDDGGYSKYAFRFILENPTKIQNMKFHAIRPSGAGTGWVYGRIWSADSETPFPNEVILSGIDGINTITLTENTETEVTINFSPLNDPLPSGTYFFGIEHTDNTENFKLQLRNGDKSGEGGSIWRHSHGTWVSYSSPIVSFIAFDLNGEANVLQIANEAITEDKLDPAVVAQLGTGDAADIDYDGTEAGLAAENVQDAIDEVVDLISAIPDPIYYEGTWDADQNDPSLPAANTVKGALYQVSVAGTQDVNNDFNPISFNVGDKVVSNGTVWEKWDVNDEVSSVNNKTGHVVLDADDISEKAENPTNLYFTDARAKTAAVVNTLSGSETDQAPSVDAVKSALQELETVVEKETFVLDSTDIANEYIDLSGLAVANSVQIMIRGAGAIMEGASYDYTVSENAGVTRITFTAGLVSELAENDVVQITYIK